MQGPACGGPGPAGGRCVQAGDTATVPGRPPAGRRRARGSRFGAVPAGGEDVAPCPPPFPAAPDPPRVVGSMSESPCQAVTISGFFSRSAKFFQTRMAPSSWGEERGDWNGGWDQTARSGCGAC